MLKIWWLRQAQPPITTGSATHILYTGSDTEKCDKYLIA